jgi:hypothetical protein
MQSKLFLIFAVFLIVSLTVLFNFAHGDAGVNMGFPVSVSSVSMNLAVHGGTAMLGLACAIVAAVLFVVLIFVSVANITRH